MNSRSTLQLPIRSAVETAAAHGITADRCVILQDGNTLVLRLSETLVALHQSLIACAAVMSAWYPVLYPDPSPERKSKLQARLDWLSGAPSYPFPKSH